MDTLFVMFTGLHASLNRGGSRALRSRVRPGPGGHPPHNITHF